MMFEKCCERPFSGFRMAANPRLGQLAGPTALGELLDWTSQVPKEVTSVVERTDDLLPVVGLEIAARGISWAEIVPG